LTKASGDLTLSVLAGEHGPARNAALLGAGLILKAGGKAHTLAECVSLAVEALDSGAAREVVARLKSLA
jgi:anthranilate phosphoribosyltransferase